VWLGGWIISLRLHVYDAYPSSSSWYFQSLFLTDVFAVSLDQGHSFQMTPMQLSIEALLQPDASQRSRPWVRTSNHSMWVLTHHGGTRSSRLFVNCVGIIPCERWYQFWQRNIVSKQRKCQKKDANGQANDRTVRAFAGTRFANGKKVRTATTSHEHMPKGTEESLSKRFLSNKRHKAREYLQGQSWYVITHLSNGPALRVQDLSEK